MRRTIALLMIVLLTAGMLLPVAQGSWKWRGTNEPDTANIAYPVGFPVQDRVLNAGDEIDQMMWTDPDWTTSGKKVYFNGFAAQSGIIGMYNPNVAATGSMMQPGSEFQFLAMLGVWKDCNQDGYVGIAESAAFEYRTPVYDATVTAGLADGICPADTTWTKTSGRMYPFNDGDWIREFIAFAPKTATQNPTLYPSSGVGVWMDYDLPGQAPRTVCPTTGNMGLSSTGRFLQWVDCFDNYRMIDTLNSVDPNGNLGVGGWDKSDIPNSPNSAPTPGWTQLYGEDGDGSGGLLGQDREQSGEGRTERAVTLWDCSATPVGGRAPPDTSPDVNAGDVSNPTNPRPNSVYEPANETYNVVTKGPCKQGTGTTSNNELPYPQLEGTSAATNAFSARDKPDFRGQLTLGNRQLLNGASAVLGKNPPTDLGLGVDGTIDSTNPFWRFNTIVGADPQLISRRDLEPAGAFYMTFYGDAGSAAGVQVRSSTVRIYGVEACGTFEAGKTKDGWNCDPAAWSNRCVADGEVIADGITPNDRCHVVGETYNVRDIDCWDGTLVRGVPVRASLVDLSDTGPCATPALTIG